MKRLCIKPVQDDALRIGINDERKFAELRLEVLEIVCTTNLHATIGKYTNLEDKISQTSQFTTGDKGIR